MDTYKTVCVEFKKLVPRMTAKKLIVYVDNTTSQTVYQKEITLGTVQSYTYFLLKRDGAVFACNDVINVYACVDNGEATAESCKAWGYIYDMSPDI